MTALVGKLILCAVFLLFSALFSGSETALMSLSRLQLGRLRRSQPGRLAFWENEPDRVLAAILVGNNLVNVGLGVLATLLALDAERLWGFPFKWGDVLIPALLVVLVIVFGEVIPKVLARNFSEPLALFLAPPVRFLTGLLAPVVTVLTKGTGWTLSRLSRRVKAESAQWNAAVIRQLLAGAPLSPRLRTVLGNLLDLVNLPAGTVMTPRLEIVAVSVALPKADFIEKVLSSGYSRVPVYKGTLDNVTGVVYAKDLLPFWRNESLIVLDDIVRPLLRVDSAMPLSGILREFRQGRHHLALVTDKNGRVQGVVTMQDALEAIVGDMAEEADLSAVP